MQLMTKLSAKKLVGKIEKPKDKVTLFQIFGIATGTKNGESNFGAWIAFTGQFRAIRVSDGEVFQAGMCFLPAMATNLMLPAVNKEGTNGVEFAFNIGVFPADNLAGYEYFAEPMIETSETDPLEQLAKKVSQAALPAPSKKKSV